MSAENSEQVKSIQCTKCAAPITLLGDRRVLSITCSYCGTCLDALDNYKIIKQFKDLERPKVPLKIGMKGKFKGAEFTIIGIIEFTETDAWGNYPWVEFLLFSETHGYAWLCLENGHYVLVREVKDIPDRNVSFNEPVKTRGFKAKDKFFVNFESSSAKVTYVEGELTWVAGIDDRIQYLDAIAPPYIYSIEQGPTEKEYSYGEYLDGQEVHKAFGVEEKPAPKGVFSCQPFRVHPVIKAVSIAGIFYAIISLAAIIFMQISYKGHDVSWQSVQGLANTVEGRSNPIPIKDAKNLISMELSSPLDNAWAFYDISVLDESGEEVYGFGKALSYYHGYEGGESWSEGNSRESFYFKVPKPGNYTLLISAEGGEGESEIGQRMLDRPLYIKIKEGCKVIRYFVLFFIAMLLCAILPLIQQPLFERERWKDYYEDQEDDD